MPNDDNAGRKHVEQKQRVGLKAVKGLLLKGSIVNTTAQRMNSRD